MRRNGLLLILAVLTIFSFSPAFAEEKVASQDIIGKWQGEWKNLYGSGRYDLIINEVKNGVFKGVMYTEVISSLNAYYANKELPITGTISGELGAERISYQYSTFLTTTLQRNGNIMEGKGCATMCSELYLTRTP